MAKKQQTKPLDEQVKDKIFEMILVSDKNPQEIELLTRSFKNLIEAENSSILRFIQLEEYEYKKQHRGLESILTTNQ